MRRAVLVVLLGLAASSGCASSRPAPPDDRPDVQSLSAAPAPADRAPAPAPLSSNAALPAPAAPSIGNNDVVAMVAGAPITLHDLMQPLIEAHGLTFLLHLAQLELVRQDAARINLTVTQKDFDEERQATLDRLTRNGDDSKLQAALDKAIANKDNAAADRLRAELKSDQEAFLTQFLSNQHIDPVEFDLVLRINTYLRKIAEPQIAGKINEEALRRAFGQMFGERVHVHYMELQNLDQVGQAKRRLAAGERFEDVTRDMSLNRPSAELGGDLPAFTRETNALPDSFKTAAFSLKDGEVSDPLLVGGSYILIKRIAVIPPRLVKYEDEKAYVRRTLSEKLLDVAVKQLKQDLAAQVVRSLKFTDANSVLARQYDERSKRMAAEADKARQDLDRQQRLRDLTGGASTAPATTQSSPAGSAPSGAAPEAATAPAGERPPATQPGNAAAFPPIVLPSPSTNEAGK